MGQTDTAPDTARAAQHSDGTPQTGRRSRHTALRRAALVLCAGMAGLALAAVPAAGPPVVGLATARMQTGRLAAAPLSFPGPSRGVPASRTPRAADFNLHCNAQLSTKDAKVGGTTIGAGTAIWASTGCGVAALVLDVPGAGRFTASFGIDDADTTGKPARVRVRVIGRDGDDTRVSLFTARHGAPSRIGVDVSGATALVLEFLDAPVTYTYGFALSGSARTLGPAGGDGSAPASGSRPLSIGSASRGCNAYTPTQPLTVTQVGVAMANAATLTGCGQLTFALPAGGAGTFAVRYGAGDTGSVNGRLAISLRALDANSRLLRKATGIAFLGGGLQPLWVDLRGARSVVVQTEGSTNVNAVVTGAGLLARHLPTYTLPNRLIHGTAAGAPIPPDAFVSRCNSYLGSSDVTVGGQPVLGGTYLATYGCGSAGLLFCNACSPTDGTVHALFGVPDNASPGGGQPTATVIVKDKDNHVLRRLTVRAQRGTRGTSIDVPIRRASVLSFSFGGGAGLLYNLRLTGTATISELIYPPTEPPVSAPGGVAISPYDFTRACNAYIADKDIRVVNATTLEGWALLGAGCGQATLSLAAHHYPRRLFSARIGIAVGESPDAKVTMRLEVLNGAGKVIRAKDVTAIYGYGWQPMSISPAGGSSVRLSWLQANVSQVIVFAMTAS